MGITGARWRRAALSSAHGPRPVATSPDSDFTLSIDEALERYTLAGLPPHSRSVQRYCAKEHLQCRLVDTPFGEKYLITPESVDKHIAYIHEVIDATSRDRPPDGKQGDSSRDTGSDKHRRVATCRDQSRPVALLDRLENENEFLRGQIGVKDGQIKEMTERARETNILIGGLQKLLAPLLSTPEKRDDSESVEPARGNLQICCISVARCPLCSEREQIGCRREMPLGANSRRQR
jgi:hypothetical protein